MNFEFSEDQLFIREQAAGFLREQCTTERVRQTLDGEQAYDQDLWQQVVDLGWPAMAIPEAYGGLGLGYLELCVIAEELGRVVAPIPFSSSVYLATELLKSAASEAQKTEYLGKLAAGEIIGTVAVSEGLGNGPLKNTAKAKTQVKDGVLNGYKLPVPDGDIADFAIVLAEGEQGRSLYLVDLNDAGVKRRAVQSMDPSRSQAELVFEGVSAELVGEAGKGAELIEALYDKAAVLFAFEQIGGGQAAMNMGMEYAKSRFAFGRAVASFQAIKHKFADMFVALELARSNAYYGAWALSSEADELPLAAATARTSATDAYYDITKENIQAHGGMGFTWEFDCHLYYRRAQLLASIIGGLPVWRERVATELLKQDDVA